MAWEHTLEIFKGDPFWESLGESEHNAGWNGQNGWFGSTTVAHRLSKGVTAICRNFTIQAVE